MRMRILQRFSRNVREGCRLIHTGNNEPAITSISIYQVDIPIDVKKYKCGSQNTLPVLDSTIVQIKTNNGLEGWGEHCPFGSTYLPDYPKGTRLGIQEIAPALIGKNPTHLQEINYTMDENLAGHPYVKAAIDIACWDILGKMAKLPLCSLFGGRFGDSVPLYIPLYAETPEGYAKSASQYQNEGYGKFMVKIFGDPVEGAENIRAVASVLKRGNTMWADGNCTFSTKNALRLIQMISDIDADFFLEQPCQTYEENLFIRRKCPFPMILDESVDSIDAVLRAARDKAADQINLKLAKFGGLTRSLQVRNLCTHLNLSMTVEDPWGWCIVNTAIAHLAHSTHPKYLNAALDFGPLIEVDTNLAYNSPSGKGNGRTAAPTGPGLGITPKMELLGEPVAVIE